ncbi:MAG: N-acetylmuramoyl-L-alanine amidase [Clostridiaceae bacterium]
MQKRESGIMKHKNNEKSLRAYIFFILLVVFFVNYDMTYNHNLLYRKSFVSLFTEKSDKKHSVVIDAGHGGIDKGTNYEDLYEKDINLKIALYMKKYFEEKGFQVYMTREEDVLLSLKDIGDFVNDKKPDVFVSVHVNSFKDPGYDGISAFYHSPDGFQNEERIELAETIQEEVSKDGIWFDRGIKEQDIAVLRYSKYVCSLVEVGFMTNKEDRAKLQNENILKNTGENIANGIIKYIMLNN